MHIPLENKTFELMNQAQSVTLESVLIRRAPLQVEILETDEGVAIDFETRRVHAPAAAAEAFHFAAAQQGTFTPADLPGSLTPKSKVMLAKKLCREGLVIFANQEEPQLAP